MTINYLDIETQISQTSAKLVVVSKTQTIETINEVYLAGARCFAENRVQELLPKYEALPKDIEWHLIGSLQSNKVGFIAPFVQLIHSVDSYKLLNVLQKEGLKCGRVIDCLLQVYIAQEKTKHGFTYKEIREVLEWEAIPNMPNVRIVGLMGMATFTQNKTQVRQEFASLKQFFEEIKQTDLPKNVVMKELSMGMSQDYEIAIEEGSTMVRIGSAIFKV